MLNVYRGNPIKEYKLNIDSGMIMIENIFNAYLGTPKCGDGYIYLRGRRLPIKVSNKKDMDKYIAMGIGALTPWHPCRAIPILEDMLEYYQYHLTKYADMFISNPLCDSGRMYNITPNCDEATIVQAYLPDITVEDHYDILNILLDIYKSNIAPIFEMGPNNVYTLVTKGCGYSLVQYEDIRIIRFNEILTIKEKYNDVCRE